MEDLQFVPKAFLDNLGTMGIGMFGVFMIIGIIIVATYVINSVCSRKKINVKEDKD